MTDTKGITMTGTEAEAGHDNEAVGRTLMGPDPIWFTVAGAVARDSIPIESVDVPGLIADMLEERRRLLAEIGVWVERAVESSSLMTKAIVALHEAEKP